MTDTTLRINLSGGSALMHDVFTNVMVDAGFEVSTEGGASIDTDVVIFLADTDDLIRLLNTTNMKRIVVVADVDPTDESIADLVLAGAEAVVNLQITTQDLAQVVRTVANGGSVIAPRPARRLSELARAGKAAISPDRPPLTNRETDILRCVGLGQSVKETAATLGITPKTVENLQSRLFRKLDVRNRAQAFAQAHALGMIRSESSTEALAE